LVINVDSKFK